MIPHEPFLYKDANPTETLKRITDIFSHLGIFVTEDNWIHNGNYLHGVRISYDQSIIAANGKGCQERPHLPVPMLRY